MNIWACSVRFLHDCDWPAIQVLSVSGEKSRIDT